jgi:HAMP domain-containing protein
MKNRLTRTKKLLSMALLAAVCSTAGPFVGQAGAQPPQGPGGGRPGGPGGRRQQAPDAAGPMGPAGRQGLPGPQGAGTSPAELQQLMDAMVVMQAERDLQLSDEQYPQFLTRLRNLQAVRRRADVARNRELMELRRLMNPNGPIGRNGRGGAGGGGAATAPDEAQLRERLKSLDEVEARAQADTRQARTAVDQLLDVRQQARFRLLEEQIERRKLDLIARSRQPGPAK